MKVGIRERNVKWGDWNTFNLLPALQFNYARGYINNYDTKRVQKSIEVEVHFSFLFFWAFCAIVFMWGDEGQIQEDEKIYLWET